MIKDIIDKNMEVKPNSKKLEALKEYFAGCFTAEGSFDIERFKDMMKDEVNISNEGYSLDFLGKDYANLIASIDTTTVIEPDLEHNSKPENKDSENVYISGDNLDALKHLLKSYAGKVKCIYIDPPYNTGSDGFVYNDSFKFTPEELEKKLSIDEDEAKHILDLTSRGSSTHSAWLMFMSPRLQLARELLSKDGIIFISIDDNEQANLKLLCDYVFGEDNFITCISRATGTPTGGGFNIFVNEMDYILVYARDAGLLDISGIEMSESDSSIYNLEDERGKYLIRPLRRTGGEDRREDRPTMYYPLKSPDGTLVYPIGPTGYDSRWICSKERFEQLCSDGLIEWKRSQGKWQVYQKFYLENRKKQPGNLWTDVEGNKKATRELRDLFDSIKVFDFPKPIDLIRKIIQIGCGDDGLVVDFFSGSATTADAIMHLNAADSNSRNYILVQWQENCNQESDAYKIKGYRTIDEIGQERIKRAAAKIKAENPLFVGDLGFKHYTLRDVPENVLDKIIEFDPNASGFANNLLEMFGRETVLETWKVRDGYGMNAKVEEVKLADYTAYQCDDHLYLTDEGMSDEAITALVDKYGEQTDWGPHYVVLFGYSFNFGATDALKKNLPLLNEGEKQIKINIDIRY
jgi:adenine specific DNA methylase Mod